MIANFEEGRQFLIDSLDANGYEHVGSAGNFLFIKPKYTEAERIVADMKKEKKILIKAYPNVGRFGNCLRVSIGEKKLMQIFLDALLALDKKMEENE
jgi:histidinol-phosphate aminotransferase